MLEVILIPFIAGFLACFLLTPLAVQFAKHFGFVDDPKTHKHPAVIHRVPIPRAGGLPMYLSILICSLFLFPKESIFLSIIFAGFFVVCVGLFDDKWDLSPYVRFGMNVICAALVVISGVSLPFITSPLGGILHFSSIFIINGMFQIPVAGVLAVVWIVWVMNMLNWSKGVDGQMPGVAAVSAIIIGIASLRFESLDQMNLFTAEMAFLVAGVSLGFLPFNFYPAKIFPGYSSTILGFIIAILSILSGVKLATAALVMGVPMTDGLVSIVRRLIAKKSPFWHDKGHLHHLLLHFGLSQRAIAIFYWVVSALLGVLALSLSSRGKLFAIMVVTVVVSGVILYLHFMTRKIWEK